MKIELDIQTAGNRIQSYGAGQVTINETIYTASLLLAPDHVIADWPPQTFADLAPQHLAAVAALLPEIVLLGTGRILRFPDDQILAPLIDNDIGYEIMDTGAACRSYNILMSEGRRVVAALLMIEGVEDRV
jgi:uncharacterized protein